MNKPKNRKFIHDLRGAINSISVNADLAKIYLQQQGEESSIGFEAVSIISKECKRLAQLIEQYESGDISSS